MCCDIWHLAAETRQDIVLCVAFFFSTEKLTTKGSMLFLYLRFCYILLPTYSNSCLDYAEHVFGFEGSASFRTPEKKKKSFKNANLKFTVICISLQTM